MINANTNGTRHQSENESGDDAAVWYSILQTGEALTEEIEQQRHQTQGHETGASGHYDAVWVSEQEALLDGHTCNENVSNIRCETRLLFCRKI